MTKFDDRKRARRAKADAEWEKEVAREGRAPWQRAVLVDLREISEGLREMTVRVFDSIDEGKRREYMQGLQALKAKIINLREKIL